MKASELRIGNLVNLMLNHEDFETIRVDVTDLINIPNGGVYEPIPVTEKWFEKFGFYRDGEYWSRGINDYKYCFKYRDWADNWAFYQEFTDSPDDRDDGVKYPISFDIKYVHQLQNLWFALLFEELTIKG
ncbi:MAG: hypothetical protein ACK5OW_01520 [bacterium]|jgi:hypothetical protein